MSSKQRKKDFPCLKCEEHVKKNDYAIQCNLCDLWVHQKCVDISDTFFKELVYQIENNGGGFWSCKSCRSATAKLNKKITEIFKKVEDLEEVTKENKSEIGALKEGQQNLDKEIENVKQSNLESSANSQKQVYAELRDREERKENLIIHNLIEPSPEMKNGYERKKADTASFREVLNSINIELDPEIDIKFLRRVGDGKNSTRPLIVGLENPVLRTKILKSSRKLADTRFKDVNIIPDLTKQQRQEDEEVRKHCDKKNEERVGEDLNFMWKAVGPRGRKRAIKVKTSSNHVPLGRNERRQNTQGYTNQRTRDRIQSEKRGREEEEEDTIRMEEQNPTKNGRH